MNRQRGVALILVLWVTALLTVLMVGFAGDARTELQLARNQYDSARAEALADAGATIAGLSLVEASPDEQWPMDGTPRSLSYGGGLIRVSIQDEAGKLDVNNAPDEIMPLLLRQIGLGMSDADQLAAAIFDWRARRAALSDSAAPARRRTNRRALAQGPFVAVEELGLVPGMTRAIYDRLRPFVTVNSPTGLIDPLSAPAELLRALPGVNQKEVEQYLVLRVQLAATPGDLPELTGVGNYLSHSGVRAATIRSRGQLPSGVSVIREALVVLSGQQNEPYAITAWRRIAAEPPPVEDNAKER